jgi:hypothetical protein
VVFEVVYFLAQMASAEAATRAAIQDLCEGRKLNAVAVVLDLVDTLNVQLSWHGHAGAAGVGEAAAGGTDTVEMGCQAR